MKYLFDHHGSDFLTITRELRELFPKEKFFSDKIKRVKLILILSTRIDISRKKFIEFI